MPRRVCATCLRTRPACPTTTGWTRAPPPGEPRTNSNHLALVSCDAPVPNFEPGSAFSYDDLAYDVAAMVIESSTGLSYAQFIAERFSRPLALAAFVRPARFADWQGPRTRGYRRTAEGWKDHDAHDLEGFHGGANIYLSARDLYRWVDGIVMAPDGKVLFTDSALPAYIDQLARPPSRDRLKASARVIVAGKHQEGSERLLSEFGYRERWSSNGCCTLQIGRRRDDFLDA